MAAATTGHAVRVARLYRVALRHLAPLCTHRWFFFEEVRFVLPWGRALGHAGGAVPPLRRGGREGAVAARLVPCCRQLGEGGVRRGRAGMESGGGDTGGRTGKRARRKAAGGGGGRRRA